MKTREEAGIREIYSKVHNRKMHLIGVIGWQVTAKIVSVTDDVFVIDFWDELAEKNRATMTVSGGKHVATAFAITTLKLLGGIDGVKVIYENSERF